MSKPEGKIETLAALECAVKNKQAVVCPEARDFRSACPAAFVINQQGALLLSLFRSGMYIYKKP